MAIKFLSLEGLQKFWLKCLSKFVAKDSNGNVYVDGALTVTSASSLNGAVTFNDTASFTDTATFANKVTVTATDGLEASKARINGEVLVDDATITIQGAKPASGPAPACTLSCDAAGNLLINNSEIATSLGLDVKIKNAIANAGHTKREIVDSIDKLPGITLKDEHTIYMVKVLNDNALTNGVEVVDSYVEYMWINDKWEKVGSSEVDLSGYSTTEEMNLAINGAIQNAHTAITANEINSLSDTATS